MLFSSCPFSFEFTYLLCLIVSLWQVCLQVIAQEPPQHVPQNVLQVSLQVCLQLILHVCLHVSLHKPEQFVRHVNEQVPVHSLLQLAVHVFLQPIVSSAFAIWGKFAKMIALRMGSTFRPAFFHRSKCFSSALKRPKYAFYLCCRVSYRSCS